MFSSLIDLSPEPNCGNGLAAFDPVAPQI